MAEPIYVAQCAEPKETADEVNAWLQAQAEEAKRYYGCTHFRASLGERNGSKVYLFEAWVKRPETAGEPRWLFEYAS